MENGVTTFLDKLFQDSNRNYSMFLSYFADYLRQKTDFYSCNYEELLRAAFFDSDRFSEEIPLRSNNLNGIDNPDTSLILDSKHIDDTSCDLFHDETQNITIDANHDSDIIPETQFDPNESNNSDTSCFLNETFKLISSTATEKSTSSGHNEIEKKNYPEKNGDFFKVAADPNDCEPPISALESQPIMANLDRSLLENFFSSDDSSSSVSSKKCIEENVSKVAKQNVQTGRTKTGLKHEVTQQADEWSASSTPEIDFDELDKLAERSFTTANTDNALIDTEDLFAQPITNIIPPKGKPNEMISLESGAHQDNVIEPDNENVFDALTQKMLTSTSDEPTFAKPVEPAKKMKSIVVHNDPDSFFEMATQPIGRQAPSNVSLNDEDIFEIATQRILSNDIYDADTQLQPSQSDAIYDAATQLQTDTNDIFDVPTQRLNVPNESKLPDFESSNGVPLGSGRVRAFSSQFSSVLTPEWSVAKLLPKMSKTNAVEKSISKKEENLKRKQQWLFNTSDDEDDNVDDDLDFDLTPNRQNESLTESKPATSKSDPESQQISKTVARSSDDRLLDDKASISNNILKPAKRVRTLSIVLSRDEVSEYLKSDNQMPVSSNLVEKSKIKSETTPKATSTPRNDRQLRKTETAVKRGRGLKTGSKTNKTPQTPPKDVPVTRNLRTKNNNNSPVDKDNKQTLKRKSDDTDTNENQKQPRKRATKATEAMPPPKLRAHPNDLKTAKKDAHKTNENITQSAKETKKTKPKVDKAPKAVPIVRENPSHSLQTCAISRRQSNRALRPKSTIDLPVNILFTKINPKPHVQRIKSLGGFIVDTPQLGTILICDTVIRTFKFLYAIIKGIPIVTSKWLDASNKAASFVPVDSFLLTDIEAEKRFRFSLKKSLEISRNVKIFEKYKFMATTNSQPVPNEIAELVRCGGGEFFFNPPNKFEANDRVVLVTQKDDNRLWRKYQRMYGDIQIVNSEGFMQCILQQKIDFKHYLLR